MTPCMYHTLITLINCKEPESARNISGLRKNMFKLLSRNTIFSLMKSELIFYIKRYHPQLVNDKYFLLLRADTAAEYFREMIDEGMPKYNAYKNAEKVLLKNLYFSKYEILKSIFLKEYKVRKLTRKDKNYIRLLLDEYEDVFNKYDLSDNFANTPDYAKLYTELETLIHKYHL